MTAGIRANLAAPGLVLGGGVLAGLLAVVGAQTELLLPFAAVAGIGVIVVALLRPIWVAYAAVLIVPMEAAIPKLGGFLSPAEILFLAAAAGWLFNTLTAGGEFPRSPLIAPFLALLAAHIPLLLLAENQFAVFKQLFMWTALFVLFMALIADRDEKTSERLAGAVAVSGALVAAIAIAKSAGGSQAVAEAGGIVTNRAVGPFASPVLLATYIMVTVPFQLMFMLRGRLQWMRIAGTGAVVLSFGALALALSRSAMVALGVACLWLLIWWRPARRAAAVGGIVVFAAVVLGFNPAPGVFKPDVIVDRITSITEPGTRTLSLRTQIWAKSPEIIQDTFPFGIGPKNLPFVADQYDLVYRVGAPSNAHNTPLVIATELGLFGVIAVLWLVIALVGVLARALRFKREPDQAMAVACAAVFVALVVDSVTGYSFAANAYSLVVMMVIAVAARIDRAAAAASVEAPEEPAADDTPEPRPEPRLGRQPTPAPA